MALSDTIADKFLEIILARAKQANQIPADLVEAARYHRRIWGGYSVSPAIRHDTGSWRMFKETLSKHSDELPKLLGGVG